MLGTLFWIISNHKRVSRAKGRGFWSSMNVTVVIQTWTLLRKVCNTMQDLCRCCKFKLWFWIYSVNSNFIILNRNVLFYVHVTVHPNKFLFNKTNRGTNFSKFIFSINSTCFGHFLCPSSRVLHCTFGTGICHQTCMTYTSVECTVENSWWWAVELPETCRISWQNKFGKLVRLLVLLETGMCYGHCFFEVPSPHPGCDRLHSHMQWKQY